VWEKTIIGKKDTRAKNINSKPLWKEEGDKLGQQRFARQGLTSDASKVKNRGGRGRKKKIE